jgi:hypothetical protein
MEIACTEGKRQSKRFFFEKKNQKTLTNSGWASAERPKLRPPTWAVTRKEAEDFSN